MNTPASTTLTPKPMFLTILSCGVRLTDIPAGFWNLSDIKQPTNMPEISPQRWGAVALYPPLSKKVRTRINASWQRSTLRGEPA